MVELIISIVILVVIYLMNYSLSVGEKIKVKKLKAYLKTLDSFEIDLDTIEVNGKNWNETVPVDIYGKELDPNSNTFYRTSGYGGFSDKYHKDKRTTKFSTKIIVPINHNNEKYKFHIKFPIEDTILRMKFYIQKKGIVYVDKKEGGVNYIIDFNFLEIDGITFISS